MKTEAAEEHEKWERDMYEKLKMKFEGDGKYYDKTSFMYT